MLDRVLLTDVDNTLFSWIGYFAPSFRAMVHAIARKAELDEDELLSHFQITFQREGSVEYRQAIQSNGLIAALPADQRDELVQLGSLVFSKVMRKYLRPYDGVKDTLQTLRRDGVHVVAVTNSDAVQAAFRLNRLGLGKLVDGLVAWRSAGHGLVEDTEERSYDEQLAKRIARMGIPWIEAIDIANTKPSTAAYEIAMEQLGLSDADVWVIGDSQSKDLAPARAMGYSTIWAAYGQVDAPADIETLLRITHWSAERVKAAYDEDHLTPDHSVARFDQVQEIIPLAQPPLF